MGSKNRLRIGNYTLFCSKNNLINCKFLFFRENKKNHLYQDPSNFKKDNPKPAYIVPISKIKERLDLHGFTLEESESFVRMVSENKLNFNSFLKMLSFIDFNQKSSEFLNAEMIKGDLKEIKSLELLGYDMQSLYSIRLFLNKNKKAIDLLKSCNIETKFLFQLDEMDPYLILRCLAEIDIFSENQLVWEYFDLVEGGWIDDLDINLKDSITYLILTEGKTDKKIISGVFNKFKLELSDLFSFTDDDFPFGGTEDMVKLCKLLKNLEGIGPVIVLLDNDGAGNKSLKKCDKVEIPNNIRVISLPELKDFNSFRTTQSKKISNSTQITKKNINGIGASIELYLDFKSIEEDPMIILDSPTHGKLDKKIKNKLQRAFHEEMEKNSQTYNYSKLRILIEYIISNCKDMGKCDLPPKK